MDNLKEVRYDLYCEHCINKDVDEGEDPCNECLMVFMRESSHKPEKFVEKA